MPRCTDPLSAFHPPVRDWFQAVFGAPTRAQALAFPPILAGRSTLLLAPTGSGKTLAAFLAAIDRLMFSAEPGKAVRCKVLYVSPLKALAVDVERNLRAPLAGIAGAAERTGAAFRLPSVDVRTGDTPQKERARMRRTPPDILITTPESLYLLLTSKAAAALAAVETVIVDEIHSLVPTKRGAHLALTLERLEANRAPGLPPLQRIGLSATQRPPDEAARLLGGYDGGRARPVEVVDAGERKRFDLTVEVPVEDMARLAEVPEVPSGPAAAGPAGRSIWPSIHPRLVDLVRQHRTTIVFANSRRLAERLAAAVNELAGEEIALAHHGSLAREKRQDIEDRLKRGVLPAIVATSSLELGIDMGSVDLVVQIEAPPSVASGMQRIGRGSHTVGTVSRGVVFPKYRGDLLACAAATAKMHEGEVEATTVPRNPLDVLAQQVVAIVAAGETTAGALLDLVRRAAPFAELPRGSFDGVLDMLSGRYPSDEFAELRPRITWDRVTGQLTPREGAARLAIVNGGTIPDRGLYGVFLSGGEQGRSRRVGELDEEMVFESRPGEVFLLGASSWRIEEITHDKVLVSPAPGEPGKMPFWHGDRPGRPRAFGEAIGALARELVASGRGAAAARLRERHGLDDKAAANLLAYLEEQREATGEVPSDRTIVVERLLDEMGDWRVCVLSPFGARVHAPWAMAIAARLPAGTEPGGVEHAWSDDGMVFRVPESPEPPAAELFLPSAAEVEDLVVRSVGSTALFAARFREAASRALLLPRRAPGRRSPLWMQRKRAADLMAAASRHAGFPIILETYRECLRDAFDLPGLVDVLKGIETRRLRVVTVDSRAASPFAASLQFSFVANFLYDGDAPSPERRAQALRVDQAQLRDLLGETELRELLDADAIAAHERSLQRLDGLYPVRHADGVHDLLLALGDLSAEEVAARAEAGAPAAEWLGALERARRVALVQIGQVRRYVAAEDAGRYRDALGVVPPRGLPEALLEPVADPLGDLVARYARTHGPFRAEAVAGRLGLGIAAVRDTLGRLARAGRVVEGEFLPHGAGRERVDAEVLRVLRRKSLARLRKEAEPVEPAAYGRFLPEWQGVLEPRDGPDALLAAIERLEGAPIPASVLETEVLPARVADYRPGDLDLLCAAGEVVWAGVEPLGPRDGRVALYLAEHEPLLARPGTPLKGDLHARIRKRLDRRGALFFADLAREVGGFPAQVQDALWDLVWAGEVTNDTLVPLRSLLRGRPVARRGPLRAAARVRRAGPPGSEGRWSLRSARWGASRPSETERRHALARALLERHGVVTREAVQAEGIAGGFSAVYEVLKAMEEAGRVRRGYFVAGCGAAQFALPGADDRLRARRRPGEAPETVVLAATDPANPYGAALPWPDTEGPRPQRAAGAVVVLVDGALVGYVGRSEQHLVTLLPPGEPERTAAARALAAALADLVEQGRRRALLIARIDGAEAAAHPYGALLAEAGFVRASRGYVRRRAGAAGIPVEPA